MAEKRGQGLRREDLDSDSEEQDENSDEEEAANFLKTFGQTSAEDLEKASLLNQWRVCEHYIWRIT